MSKSKLRPRPRLWAQALEERWLPSLTPVGPLARPYTFSEVMASIRAEDPIRDLAQWTAQDSVLASEIDPSNSRVILSRNHVSLVKVHLKNGTDPLAAVHQLKSQPGVEWAEPNYIHVGDPRDLVPDDPFYGSQYHHPLMQNNKAWDVQSGNPAIVLAVLDDGVALEHPDLAPGMWVNGDEVSTNGIDDDGNGYVDDYVGWDFASNDANPNPNGVDTHGTHVAGIAGARTNNATGGAGVAGGKTTGDGIRLMPIRWYGTGNWTASIVAESFAYAANNGAKIANASYNFDGWVSGGVPNATVWSALEYAYSKDVLIFLSAGNNAAADPARGLFDQALFVASTNDTDARSAFSNYGSFIDISAPGSAILSTVTDANGTIFNYTSASGTSMSTPNAAGVAALIWSEHPTWTRDQVAAQLIGTADSIDSANPSLIDQLGTGRANSFRAVTETMLPPRFGALTGLPAINGVVDKLPTSFSLRAPMRFAPSTVAANRFELRGDGADNLFDTADDVVIPLILNSDASYRIGVGQLTFETTAIGSADRYRFKASSALQDPFGQALDGNGDGIGGDDYVHVFLVSRQIEGVVFEDRNADGVRNGIEPTMAGRLIYLDQDGDGTFDSTTTNFAAADLPQSILDYTTTSSTISVAGFTGQVTDVNIKLSLSHPYNSNLSAFLISPTGTKVELFSEVGGGGANFTGTIFDDQAALGIGSGVPPYLGSFRPETPLSKLNGLNPNGTWQLQITDNSAYNTGTLNDWSIDLTTSEPFTFTNSQGVYAFNGLDNGSYLIRQFMPLGWNPGPGPGGGAYVVNITGLGDQEFGRDFGQLRQNAIYGRVYDDANHSGDYSPGEAPLPNWNVFFDNNGNGVPDSNQEIIAASNVPVIIPDQVVTTSTISVAGSVGPIADVDVELSINHAAVSELEVYLIGPSGETVELFTSIGGSGSNFTNTAFDDQAAMAITSGSAPFTGTFRPEGTLADFNGLVGNGIWTLQIFDHQSGTTGTLTAWSLSIKTIEPTTTTASDGSFVFTDLSPGNYLVRRQCPAGYTVTQPAAGSYAVNLSVGQTASGRDFGQTQVPPPAKVTQVLINEGGVQRSFVRSLKVTFDQNVSLPYNSVDAFQLKRQSDGAIVGLAAIVSANTVTLTFVDGPVESTSLADGRYTLTIFAPQVNNGMFDGDSDGKAGGDYVLASDPYPMLPTNIFRLMGDGDGDGTVSSIDFALLRESFGTGMNLAFDFNDNVAVDSDDLSQFRRRFGVMI